MPTIQLTAISVPSLVATPLPPLNFSHTGNWWPRIAAPPAITVRSSLTRRAISTATAPLPPSSSSVASARSLRPVRSTLVAPMLPEPMLRMSPRPASLVSSRPKGIEPSR